MADRHGRQFACARSRRLKQKGIRTRSVAFFPNVVADTESKANHQRYTGSDLKDVRANIGDAMITPGPPPGAKKGITKWIPCFSLELKKGKKSTSVYPGDNQFDGMWRRVTLRKD